MSASGQELKNINDFTESDIAQALFNQSRALFISIPFPKNSETPDLSPMRAFFENLCAHVQSDILGENKLKDRARMMGRWMTILVECYKKGDLHSVAAISAALTSFPISRLTITNMAAQEALPASLKNQFVMIMELTRSPTILNRERHIVPSSVGLSINYAQTKEQIDKIVDSIDEAKKAEESTDVLNVNLQKTQKQLIQYNIDWPSRHKKAQSAPINQGGAAETYIESLDLSYNPLYENAEEKAAVWQAIDDKFLKKSKSIELNTNKIDLKKDNLKVAGLKIILTHAATGALRPLIDDILQDKTLLDNIKPSVVSDPLFMQHLNELLVNRSPDKSRLTHLLGLAGITLDSGLTNKNYKRVCKQVRYWAEIDSPELKALIGNQYFRGKANNFEKTNTKKKVQALNDFFKHCQLPWEDMKGKQGAQSVFKELLDNVGIYIDRDDLKKSWQRSRDLQVEQKKEVTTGSPASDGLFKVNHFGVSVEPTVTFVLPKVSGTQNKKT